MSVASPEGLALGVTALGSGLRLPVAVTAGEAEPDLLMDMVAVLETVAVQEEETVLTRILTPSLSVAAFTRFQPPPVFM